jgi:ribonuclease HII
MMKAAFDEANAIEVGIDESGRGPMMGRLYVAAVVLPPHGFDHSRVCDSKKIKSRKKMREAAEYVKSAALAYRIHYVEADVVDSLNVLQANMSAMHACIRELLSDPKLPEIGGGPLLLVDGDYFKPYITFDKAKGEIVALRAETVVGGDGEYSSIAAASILAKDARDAYIERLCAEYPELISRYGIDSNKGYGAKRHMAGIREHGISQFHRRSFGLCKTASLNLVSSYTSTIIASIDALDAVA